MTVITSHLTRALPGTALNWIDGEWVNANKTTNSFDSATGKRIGPSQFSPETGTVVGANCATAPCGEWQEDEWQELLARLSTGCQIQGGSQGAEELEHAVSERRSRGALINGYSNVGPDESVHSLDDERVLELWGKGGQA